MTSTGFCYATLPSTDNESLVFFRLMGEDKAEMLNVCQSFLQISYPTPSCLQPMVNIASQIEFSVYERALMAVQAAIQSYEDVRANCNTSSNYSENDTMRRCLVKDDGIYFVEGIPNNSSKLVLAGIHLSDNTNLHRSLRLLDPSILCAEGYMLAETNIYLLLDKQMNDTLRLVVDLLKR